MHWVVLAQCPPRESPEILFILLENAADGSALGRCEPTIPFGACRTASLVRRV